MLQNYFEMAVLLSTAYVINGDVNMTSPLTPYQVTFGEDGRLRMEDFKQKTPCGHVKKTIVEEIEEIPHTSEAGFTDEPVTTGGQEYGYTVEPTTAFYEAPQSPCVTHQTTSSDIYSTTISSFPLRMDFTLKSPESNVIEVRFMRGKSEIYVVEFINKDNLIEIDNLSAPLELKFDASHRFWVTYENGEIQVGLHGNDEPLIHYIDPEFTTNEEVDGIELYSKTSTPTEWKFYEPCTI